MKIFTNLPGNLRALFGILRVLTIALTVLWFLALCSSLALGPSQDLSRRLISVGDVLLQWEPGTIELKSDMAKSSSLELAHLRAALRVDLSSQDRSLVLAVSAVSLPSIAVLAVFGWLFFGSLKELCGNIERGNVFSEENLRLVRKTGWIILGGNLLGMVLCFVAQQVMNNYLSAHVILAGIQTGSGAQPGHIAVRFISGWGELPVSGIGGFVTGFLVLMLSEAFRQGLNLKAENDLTV